MRIANPRHFALGMVLAVSFLAVLVGIFSPVFGNGRNGLEYADDIFNRLSKGSSYFIPKATKQAETQAGTAFSVVVKISDKEAELASRLLAAAGATVERRDKGNFALSGDLGQVLAAAVRDSEAGFRNDDDALTQRYGAGGQAALAAWWRVLKQTAKALAADRRVEQSDAVVAVMKKAIEPAHNYFGIEAESVGNMPWTMTGLLVFYVLYTIWWGSAIYYLFEGIGLIMSKEKPAESPAVLDSQSAHP